MEPRQVILQSWEQAQWKAWPGGILGLAIPSGCRWPLLPPDPSVLFCQVLWLLQHRTRDGSERCRHSCPKCGSLHASGTLSEFRVTRVLLRARLCRPSGGSPEARCWVCIPWSLFWAQFQGHVLLSPLEIAGTQSRVPQRSGSQEPSGIGVRTLGPAMNFV